MNLIGIKILATLLILLITIIAAWLPFRKRIKQDTGQHLQMEALATGIFLGVGLIHMLGEASEQFNMAGYHYPFAFLLSGFTFLSLLLLEHIGIELSQHKHENAPTIALLAVFMLSLHSVFEGSAIGISQTLTETLIITFAIIAHKWAASFALAVKINKTTLPIKSGMGYFALFALMTPLGVILSTSITHYFSSSELLPAILHALAAGTFIYIGTVHGLHRSVLIERCCNLKEFAWVSIGFITMALLAVL